MSGLRERLLLLVERAGSARELSRRAGLTEIHVGQIVRRLGQQPAASVELKTLAAIAHGGQVSESWLLTGRGSPDDVDDAQQHPLDEPEAVPRQGVRTSTHEPHYKPELQNLPDWPELLRGAREMQSERGRSIPAWAWEAVATSSLLLSAAPTAAMIYDLARLFTDHNLGKPKEPRAETGTTPTTKG